MGRYNENMLSFVLTRHFAYAILLIAIVLICLHLLPTNIDAANIVDRCKTLTDTERTSCYRNLADRLLNLDRAEMREVFSEDLQGPNYYGACHELSHYIGYGIYAEKMDMPAALSECTPACSSGCYHGVAAAYMFQQAETGTSLNDDLLVQIMQSVDPCAKYRESECKNSDILHGFGDALLTLTTNDLNRSLSICSKASRSSPCYDGVFTANFVRNTDPRYPAKPLRANDPLYPCNEVEAEYQQNCFRVNADFLLTGSIEENLAICKQFPVGFRSYCISHIAAIEMIMHTDISQLASICDGVDPNFKELCLSGIVNRLWSQNTKPRDYVAQFCAIQNAPFDESCRDHLRYLEQHGRSMDTTNEKVAP